MISKSSIKNTKYPIFNIAPNHYKEDRKHFIKEGEEYFIDDEKITAKKGIWLQCGSQADYFSDSEDSEGVKVKLHCPKCYFNSSASL